LRRRNARRHRVRCEVDDAYAVAANQQVRRLHGTVHDAAGVDAASVWASADPNDHNCRSGVGPCRPAW
jgi:hypothetical protein